MPKKNGDAPSTLVPEWYMDVVEGEEAYTVAESAYNELLRLGMKLPSRPRITSRFLDDDGCPLMPRNVMELDDYEIGELYGLVQAYYSYVGGQLARVKTEMEQALKQVKFVSARVRIGKDGTAKDKDDRRQTDRRFVIADARSTELIYLHTLMSAVVAGCEGDLKLISRQITLRDQNLKTETRGAAIAARKRFTSERPRVGSRAGTREKTREPVPATKVKRKAAKAIRPPRRRRAS